MDNKSASHSRALLQSSGEGARRRPAGSEPVTPLRTRAAHRQTGPPRPGKCHQDRRRVDNAGFAADVTGDVERRRLSFAERAHHFEALDRCVGRLQGLEASDRSDQLLQFAVVSLDDVVQVLDLSMQRLLGTSAFLLQLGESGGIGRRLVGVDDTRRAAKKAKAGPERQAEAPRMDAT